MRLEEIMLMFKRFLFVSCVQLALCALGQAQVLPEVSKFVSDKTYNDVLDVVFPREPDDGIKTDWSLTLRFKPYGSSESQLVLRKTISEFEVIEYRSINGIIFNQLNAWLARNGKEDVGSMSKSIQVSERRLRFKGANFARWKLGFFNAIKGTASTIESRSREYDRTGAWTVLIHAAMYEVWFKSNQSEMKFSVTDDEPGKKVTGKIPLSYWMNRVRLEIGLK